MNQPIRDAAHLSLDQPLPASKNCTMESMSNKRVLVIDDEPDIRELLEITLSRMGLDVETAADLREGRRALASATFDLCLTDMRLPDGNGLDLVEDIACVKHAVDGLLERHVVASERCPQYRLRILGLVVGPGRRHETVR